MSKYNTLINILDQLRKEAPPAYKSYHPLETDTDKLDKARSKAFIHLYLKAKFGLLDFLERESYITDGTYDGGIDAYILMKKGKRSTSCKPSSEQPKAISRAKRSH